MWATPRSEGDDDTATVNNQRSVNGDSDRFTASSSEVSTVGNFPNEPLNLKDSVLERSVTTGRAVHENILDGIANGWGRKNAAPHGYV